MHKPTFFITAYGIAVKHGFQGTEKEWLYSLTAFHLAQQAGYTGTMEQWLEILNDPIPTFSIGTVETLPGGSEATVTVGGTRRQPVLNFGIPRGVGMVDALPLVGGIMQGNIDMGQFALTGLPSPEADADAAPKVYVDSGLKTVLLIADAALKAAGEASDAASKAASAANIAQIAAGNIGRAVDMAQRTADAKAQKKPFLVALPASGWDGYTPPYTQTVQLEGILLSDNPYYGVMYSGDYAQMTRQKTAYGCIDDLQTADGAVTFTCFDSKPDVDLVIQMEVFR